MQNTVQIVLNSNTKLLKSKYDLKFTVSRYQFVVNVNLKIPNNNSETRNLILSIPVHDQTILHGKFKFTV